MRKRIIILANSRKLCGKCIAGKDYEGNWIRLTKSNNAPIPSNEARSYRMLNVIDVDGLVNNASTQYNYHTENATYSSAQLVSVFDRTLLETLLDNPDDVFGEGKYVDEDQAQELDNSLMFIKVREFLIYKKDGGQYRDTLRGSFVYNNQYYIDISITDTLIEERLQDFNYPYQEYYDEAYITISLGEIYREAAYKLISGVVIL